MDYKKSLQCHWVNHIVNIILKRKKWNKNVFSFEDKFFAVLHFAVEAVEVVLPEKDALRHIVAIWFSQTFPFMDWLKKHACHRVSLRRLLSACGANIERWLRGKQEERAGCPSGTFPRLRTNINIYLYASLNATQPPWPANIHNKRPYVISP